MNYGKICYINGQPFMVTLPTGGKNKNDYNNQWDELINFPGEESNDIFHWKEMYSWCQEVFCKSDHVVRGCLSARYWEYSSASYRYLHVGFRPVLIPLDSYTLKSNPSLLEDIADGEKWALASLYMNEEVHKNPNNPTHHGDVPDYIPGAEITLDDRDSNPENWLYVIKYKDLLWADRNVLKNISLKDLTNQGFISEG